MTELLKQAAKKIGSLVPSAAVQRQLKIILSNSILGVSLRSKGDLPRNDLIKMLAKNSKVTDALSDLYSKITESVPQGPTPFDSTSPALASLWTLTKHWATAGEGQKSAFYEFLKVVFETECWGMCKASKASNEKRIKEKFGLPTKVPYFTENMPAFGGQGFLGQPTPSQAETKHETQKTGSALIVSNLSSEQGKGDLEGKAHPDAFMANQSVPIVTSTREAMTDISAAEPTKDMNYSTSIQGHSTSKDQKQMIDNKLSAQEGLQSAVGGDKLSKVTTTDLEQKSGDYQKPSPPGVSSYATPTVKAVQNEINMTEALSALMSATRNEVTAEGQQQLNTSVWRPHRTGMGSEPNTVRNEVQTGEETKIGSYPQSPYISDLGTSPMLPNNQGTQLQQPEGFRLDQYIAKSFDSEGLRDLALIGAHYGVGQVVSSIIGGSAMPIAMLTSGVVGKTVDKIGRGVIKIGEQSAEVINNIVYGSSEQGKLLDILKNPPKPSKYYKRGDVPFPNIVDPTEMSQFLGEDYLEDIIGTGQDKIFNKEKQRKVNSIIKPILLGKIFYKKVLDTLDPEASYQYVQSLAKSRGFKIFNFPSSQLKYTEALQWIISLDPSLSKDDPKNLKGLLNELQARNPSIPIRGLDDATVDGFEQIFAASDDIPILEASKTKLRGSVDEPMDNRVGGGRSLKAVSDPGGWDVDMSGDTTTLSDSTIDPASFHNAPVKVLNQLFGSNVKKGRHDPAGWELIFKASKELKKDVPELVDEFAQGYNAWVETSKLPGTQKLTPSSTHDIINEIISRSTDRKHEFDWSDAFSDLPGGSLHDYITKKGGKVPPYMEYFDVDHSEYPQAATIAKVSGYDPPDPTRGPGEIVDSTGGSAPGGFQWKYIIPILVSAAAGAYYASTGTNKPEPTPGPPTPSPSHQDPDKDKEKGAKPTQQVKASIPIETVKPTSADDSKVLSDVNQKAMKQFGRGSIGSYGEDIPERHMPVLRAFLTEGNANIISEILESKEAHETNISTWNSFRDYYWEGCDEPDNHLHMMNVIEETRRFSGMNDQEELFTSMCSQATQDTYDSKLKEMFEIPDKCLVDGDALVLDTRGGGPLTTQTADEVEATFHDVYLPDWYSIPANDPLNLFTPVDGTNIPDSLMKDPNCLASNDAPALYHVNRYIATTDQ